MRLIAALVFLLAFASAPAFAADTFEFDKEHTHILFFVNHLGYSDMMGLMTKYDGSFKFDPNHPETGSVDITIHPAGIRTTSELLDKVLQGENFFNTDKFPDIHFVSQEIKIKDKRSAEVKGALTMLGESRVVLLNVRFNKIGYHPMTQNYVAGFSADATLKRSDFGMDYLLPMVGDEVRIEIEVEGIDMDRKKAEKIKHGL